MRLAFLVLAVNVPSEIEPPAPTPVPDPSLTGSQPPPEPRRRASITIAQDPSVRAEASASTLLINMTPAEASRWSIGQRVRVDITPDAP